MKKVIIIGASSGIGCELAKIFSKNKYIVGIAARRVNLLKDLQTQLKTQTYIRYIDISNTEGVDENLNELIETMGGVDIIVISSGVGYINEELEWEKEKKTIDVNVSGFTAVMNTALKYFIHEEKGTIVGISSIASIRGSWEGPAYSASKAYVSNYMEGIRCKVKKLKKNIKIINIMPGLVDTDMAKGEGLFWVESPEKAASQIYNCIVKGKENAYITKKWALIAWLLKILPDRLYYKI